MFFGRLECCESCLDTNPEQEILDGTSVAYLSYNCMASEKNINSQIWRFSPFNT
jgi:hypothetical protein